MSINFEIIEHIGILKKYQNGWTKELNRVSWNQSNPKYDIRDWDPTHKLMTKGITLTKEELETLEIAIVKHLNKGV